MDELQEEEREVLSSIYDGDDAFKQVSPTSYQYKVGEDGDFKSFLVDIGWGDGYPDELPCVHLNAFYNKHVAPSVKKYIVEQLMEQAEMFIGCAMTYSLFDFAKENATDLVKDQHESFPQQSVDETKEKSSEENQRTRVAKVRKDQLTKAQKRKIVNRMDNKGEMPRGHDWVDVVKHLSQSGRHAQQDAEEKT